MSAEPIKGNDENGSWHFAMHHDQLLLTPVKMQRVAGRQIAFFNTENGVRACDNRCPHEGYPLSEGSLSDSCTLTCNWHNWKFNLESGENLYGGDRLRTYPVEIRNNEIWVDVTELPFAERYSAILSSLKDAIDDYSYDRIAREIARLGKLGADPFDALRIAIEISWEKLEFGWTHAYAGMSDWIELYRENQGDQELQLVCLVESVAHVAYDVLREQNYPYADESRAFDQSEFIEAIEREDELTASAMIRGGIGDGLKFVDFEAALSSAALLHYNDFGHSLIYVTKARILIEALGEKVMEALLLSLVRGMIFASREDRIPEFRAYAKLLPQWGQHKNKQAKAEDWWQQGINKSMQATRDCSGDSPGAIYHALLMANAANMLHFDSEQQNKIHVSVSGNVNWLDFTHGITFANAVRQQCHRFPELWPQGLLQMACFNGRNAAFTRDDKELERWLPDDVERRLSELIGEVLNHGQGEHIVSVHLLKTVLAVREEVKGMEVDDAAILVAALARFFESPLKRRQPRRTAHQSLQFVAKE